MSGVVRGVGKVFKKVASGAAKILPIALATGAVLFTAGNALGLTSSWGDAVKSVTDSLGAGSTLSNVISGAVENAGYGAVAGAATSAISGGSAMEGAQYGAATGAVLGGAKGAYDSYTAPATAATGNDAATTGARADTSPPASDAARGGSDSILRANQSTTGPTTSTTSPSNAATGAPAGTSAAAAPGILDKGGWLERNGTLAGNALKGLGTGLAASDAGDAQAKALQQRAEIVRANYGGRTGLLTAANAAQASAGQAPGMTPQQRFSAAGVQGQYVYDPATGRYTLVQQQATA